MGIGIIDEQARYIVARVILRERKLARRVTRDRENNNITKETGCERAVGENVSRKLYGVPLHGFPDS